MRCILSIAFSLVVYLTTAQQTAHFKTLGTPLTEEGRDVVLDNDGNIYVLSSSNAQAGQSANIMLTALDNELNCLWNNFYGWNYIESPVEMVYIEPHFYIVGAFLSTFSASYDTFVLQVNADGTEGWMQTFGGADWDLPMHVAVVNGQVYVVVNTQGGDGSTQRLYSITTDGVVEESFELNFNDFSDITFFGHWNNQFVFAANTAFQDTPQQTAVFFVDESNGAIVSSFDVAVENADEVIIHDMIERNGLIYYCGEVHTNDRIDAMYRRCDATGVTDVSSILDANGNSNYISIAAYDDRVVLPGYTKFAGAGGKDAFVMILTVDGYFLGAPTFGGVEDDYFNAAVHTEDGGVVAVGDGFSYNGNSGETIVLALNVANSGDYQQFFDTDNECIVVSVDEQLSKTNVLHVGYFDMMGRKLNINNRSDWFEGMIYVEVSTMSTGEVVRMKRMYQSLQH